MFYFGLLRYLTNEVNGKESVWRNRNDKHMIMVYVTFVLYSIRKYFHGTLLFFYHISFKVPCCEKDWHSANNACSSQLNFNLRDEEMRFQRER